MKVTLGRNTQKCICPKACHHYIKYIKIFDSFETHQNKNAIDNTTIAANTNIHYFELFNNHISNLVISFFKFPRLSIFFKDYFLEVFRT
jgi:hypothetical protein